MTLQECTALLVPIALARRAEMDEPTFRAYHRVLKDVPVMLAQAALETMEKAGLEFMPTAPKILHASEIARRQMLALHPYDGCAECDQQRGYRTIFGMDGQKAVERCPCLARHREKLEGLGILSPFAALPGEAGVGESEPVYPTVEQLPPALRTQLVHAAHRRLMR